MKGFGTRCKNAFMKNLFCLGGENPFVGIDLELKKRDREVTVITNASPLPG